MEREDIVFEIADWRGRLVRLTKRTFETHKKRHPEFTEYIDAAKQTIQDPDIVAEADNGVTALFRFGLGRRAFANLYLVVIVYYKGSQGVEATHHFARNLGDLREVETRYYVDGRQPVRREEAEMTERTEQWDGDAFAKAHIDLGERLFKEGVSIAYDEDGDTLFLTIGPGKEAVTEQVVDGIYFRVEPENLKVVGCVIMGFVSDILANNKLARKLFQSSFEQLRQQGDSVQWEGSQAQKVRPLFELIPR